LMTDSVPQVAVGFFCGVLDGRSRIMNIST
jgi:hypothetical protein